MESLPAPPEPPGSSPPHLLSLLPRIYPQIAGGSSPSTSPSSLGAKLLTWLPSAAPPMAMQACTHPSPHSARPAWTSTNCTCPVPSLAKSLMRERTRRTRWRIHQWANKVGQQESIITKVFPFWFDDGFIEMLYFAINHSVPEESGNDPNQSHEGDLEASPSKSPTTPKNIKCKNSSGTLCPKHVLWCKYNGPHQHGTNPMHQRIPHIRAFCTSLFDNSNRLNNKDNTCSWMFIFIFMFGKGALFTLCKLWNGLFFSQFAIVNRTNLSCAKTNRKTSCHCDV